MAGNYDKMQEQARQLFRTYDPEKLRARLGLPAEEAGIPIRFLGEMYLVRASDGEVADERGEKAPFDAAMSIYDVLCRSERTPVLSGAWVPTMELHHIMGSNSVHEDLGQRDAAFPLALLPPEGAAQADQHHHENDQRGKRNQDRHEQGENRHRMSDRVRAVIEAAEQQ